MAYVAVQRTVVSTSNQFGDNSRRRLGGNVWTHKPVPVFGLRKAYKKGPFPSMFAADAVSLFSPSLRPVPSLLAVD